MEQHTHFISVGTLWKNSLAFYKKFYKNFASIALPLVAIVLIASVVSQIDQYTDSIGWHVFLGILIAVIAVMIIVLSLLFVPAIIIEIKRLKQDSAAENRHSNDEIMEGAYRQSAHIFWSYIWIAILAGLVGVAAYALFIIPGIFVQGMLAFSAFVFIFEGKKGAHALASSWKYVRGHWWAVFGRVVLLVIGLILSIIVVGIVSGIIGYVLHDNSFAPLIIRLVQYFVLAPFCFIYMSEMYHSLKHIKPHGPTEEEVVKIKNMFLWIFVVGAIFAVILFGVVLRAAVQSFRDYIQSNQNIMYHYGSGTSNGPMMQWGNNYPEY